MTPVSIPVGALDGIDRYFVVCTFDEGFKSSRGAPLIRPEMLECSALLAGSARK
jgi:hypothetical protein